MTARYIVVVNREGSGERPTVHKALVLSEAIKNARRAWSNMEREREMWTPQMDARLKSLYASITKEEVAKILSIEFKKEITKSAVIGRHNRLRGREERERLWAKMDAGE